MNGSAVTSGEIADYVLQKIKKNGNNNQMDMENVYLIPHASKPVNEYFNPKLLTGLYPTLFLLWTWSTRRSIATSPNQFKRTHTLFIIV